jgi:glycosyltransferase involved in cell wall biosynthesis
VKIGILAHDFLNWSGGIDFLWLVTDSLLACPRAKTAEFHLLVPDSGIRLAWRRARESVGGKVGAFLSAKKFPSVSGLASDAVCSAFLEFGNRIAIRHVDIGRGAIHRAAKRLGLDVILPAVHSIGADFLVPWLAYAYDFQHRYFPENFTPQARASRDEHFARLLTEARAVIVNSRAAANDIARFVPQATARIFTLPFAPAPRPDWLKDRPEILSRYDVAKPYFIISNQFWAHKNHATAFEAFRLIATANRSLSLVCTGLTNGSTDPAYFPGLLAFLKKAGLEHRVQILGLIPKRDQIELMKHACAVVQPTLFEGGPGGGALYDAVSLRVPAIVSNIPVNRELPNASNISFFPARDAVALAKRMELQLTAPPKKIPPEELISDGQRCRVTCGGVLWNAIDFLL